MKRDLYSLVGLESDASMDLIESAYRKLVSELYPDRREHDRKIFLRIQKAYSTLTNAVRRKAHDEALHGGEKPLNLTPQTPVGVAGTRKNRGSWGSFLNPFLPNHPAFL